MHEPPLEGVHDQVVVGAAAVHREDVARRGEARIEEGLPPLELDRVRGLGPYLVTVRVRVRVRANPNPTPNPKPNPNPNLEYRLERARERAWLGLG